MVERRRDNIPNSTQIPNVFIDKLMPVVSPATWKIISFVSRKTYGWGKQWDEISITQIEKGTGLSNRCVIDTMTELRDAGVVLRGEQKSYGWEWSLNLDCEVDDAIELLRPKERAPRSKPSGGRKKDVSSHEPGSQHESEGHEPSSLGYEQSAGAPSSRAPMNPVHLEPMNPVQLQKPTSLMNKPTIKRGEQNPPKRDPRQENLDTLDRKRLMEWIEQLSPQVGTHVPNRDAELFDRLKLASEKSGLSYTRTKELLRVYDVWRKWPWLDELDSQQEIAFPETA